MKNEIDKYTGYLFKLALNKCGDLYDAEDLTQDTLLAAYQYIHRGGEITNIKYWLTSTLSHKYNDMLRRKYKLPTVSIDVISDDIEYDEQVQGPTAEEVRREVVYLAKLQREVIVRHYLQGEKVQAIALDLGVPKGTVLSRLSSGREQMRKGFEVMEIYSEQSYRPERLDIGCHGCQGFHDEPWSLVAGDLMKQNILIAAYEKPVTVVEISRALGIPTAYVETAVNDLVTSELMAKTGNKVFTDFMITTPEQILRGLDVQIEPVEKNYDLLLGFIKEYLNELGALPLVNRLSDCKQKKLKYYFVLHLFSHALYSAVQRIVPSKEEYPLRPDGGRWIAEGFRYPQNFDFSRYRFAQYCYGGERGTHWDHILNAKSIDLKVYDTQPDLNLYQHGPIELSDDDLAKLLYIISRGIPFENTGFNLMLCEDIPHLVKCGVLGDNNGKVYVNIPILTPAEYELLDGICCRYTEWLTDIVEPWIREIFPKLKIEIPKHLDGRVAEFRRYSCYAIPMTFIKRAVESGDLDTAEAIPPMVFVVDDENENIR